MKAMLEARMVAARIQGAAAGVHGALAGAARAAASSQGSLAKAFNVGGGLSAVIPGLPARAEPATMTKVEF
jgi:hypothetical protein